jgi:SAM-dependent methyltransferase
VVLVSCLALKLDGDARGAALSGYDNASQASAVQSLAKSVSDYYRLDQPANHRAYVGGKWDELGRLQLAFLRSRGLEPQHLLLDLGCGALRAGVHLVAYLEGAHYYGIDLNVHLMEAGYERELRPLGLAPKLPRTHLAVSSEYDASSFGVQFDFVMAHSVWTHLPLEQIARCVSAVARVLKPSGRFYATLHIAPENASLARPIVQHGPPPHGSDRDQPAAAALTHERCVRAPTQRRGGATTRHVS